MKRLLLLIVIATTYSAWAQSDSVKEFRPSLSPLILTQGQVEIGNGFNYGHFQVDSSLYRYKSRYKVFGNAFQATYGLKSFLNVGIDYNFLLTSKTISENGANFEIKYWSTMVGPRVRWSPFDYNRQKRFSHSFQHSVLFTLRNSLDDGGMDYYTAVDLQKRQPTYSSQMLFMHGVGQRLIFLFQTDFSVLPKKANSQLRPLTSSSYLYMSWMPNTRMMFFVLTNYVTQIGSINGVTQPKKYYLLSENIGLGPGIQIGTSKFSWSISYLHTVFESNYINEPISMKTFNTSLRWKLIKQGS